MRSVVLTATLFSAFLVFAAQAAAQDPEAPPPPPQPAPRDIAVPRGERITVREPESRPEDASTGGRVRQAEPARESREAPQPPRAETAREPRGETGAVIERRGARRANPADAAAESRPLPGEAAAAVAAPAATAEEQRGERRGAVRRPPSDSGGPGGRIATGDRAVPRTSAPRPTQRVFVYPDYYRYYNRYYDPWGYGGFGLGYFYYSPWAWNAGYGYPGYAYGYGYGRQYGYDVGSVRLKVKPRDAEVYVDGYFAGHVDDFDGIFQSLKLDSGGYRIEIRKPGYETLHFDVRVQPDRNITFRGEMRPAP